MRERKMFFPPALRLAAVAIALSAAALALPLPVFAVLDRAAGHSIAVQQDAEALSPAGRSCAAARELYCWRMFQAIAFVADGGRAKACAGAVAGGGIERRAVQHNAGGTVAAVTADKVFYIAVQHQQSSTSRSISSKNAGR